MCGRYSLTKESEEVAKLFDLPEDPRLAPRYNIAPAQPVGAVIEDAELGQCQWRLLHWGLIPGWAKDTTIGNRMINARSETAAGKPAFRSAMKYRRCLLAADGFYEWKKAGQGKQPYYIRMADEGLFALAGLWEHWQGEHGEEIESCAILTTEPNALMREIHNRMPVILEPDDHAAWLDPQMQDASAVQHLLRPLHAERMVAQPIGKYVNNPRNEGPRCIKADEPEGLFE